MTPRASKPCLWSESTISESSSYDEDFGQVVEIQTLSPASTNSTTESTVASFMRNEEADDIAPTTESSSSSLYSSILSSMAGAGTAALVTAFAWKLPYWTQGELAKQTFIHAGYHYNAEHSFFDHTAWTYVTDYLLAMVMVWWTIQLSKPSSDFSFAGRSLLASYAFSVTCGGLCHQYLYTVHDRSQLLFRGLWTLCVGCVTLASTWMGLLTSAAMRDAQHTKPTWMPYLPDSFWKAYGSVTTIVCICGGTSYQRPACDTFIAGITQFPSTFYAVAYFLAVAPHWTWRARLVAAIAWLGNAPLLPLYPILLHYTTWSLATINTFLHCWLLTVWSLQGWSLHRVVQTQVDGAVSARKEKAL
jgi:hypothetical protein